MSSRSTCRVVSPRNSVFFETLNFRLDRGDGGCEIGGAMFGDAKGRLPQGGDEFLLLVEERMLASIFRCSRIRPSMQRLGPRRAAGNIDVHRDELVDALEHGVAAIHAAAGGAGAHGDAPLRLGHLVPDPLHRERHLVGHRAGDDHHVALARAKSASPPRRSGRCRSGRAGGHQLDGAAGEAHRHRPERVLAHPVDGGIEPGEDDVALDLRVVGNRAGL